MRVRPQRPTDRRPVSQRRPVVIGRQECEPPAAPAEASARSAAPDDQNLLAGRRHRASVAPEDSALYACQCGFQFQAAVTTSVCCPHCGTGQAW